LGSTFFILSAKGFFCFGPSTLADAFRCAPSHAIISAAAEQNADVIPVADTGGTFPRLAPGEHGALRRDDDAWNVIQAVGGIFADGEEVLFFNVRLGGREEATERNGDDVSEFHGSWQL
jgi:hypothetical protein